MLPYRKELKGVAQKLRREQTPAEYKLWGKIRGDQLGVRFYRQKPVADFIVDFYCPTYRLVIEADGHQHFNAGKSSDEQRDMTLNKLGLTVLRFTNRDILTNINGVLDIICRHIESPAPTVVGTTSLSKEVRG